MSHAVENFYKTIGSLQLDNTRQFDVCSTLEGWCLVSGDIASAVYVICPGIARIGRPIRDRIFKAIID